MKEITTKVIPLAICNYPGVQMVQVMYNSQYHHVCSFPSLTSFFKKNTVNLMKDHGIDYVILLLTNELISILPEKYNHNINNGHLQITFNKENLQKRKIKSNALENPSAEEIKVATVVLLKLHNPEVLY